MKHCPFVASTRKVDHGFEGITRLYHRTGHRQRTIYCTPCGITRLNKADALHDAETAVKEVIAQSRGIE